MDTPRLREAMQSELESITDQINEGLQSGRYTLAQLQGAVTDKTKRAAESTNQLVHDYPWSAIGVGIVLGVAVGLILPRR